MLFQRITWRMTKEDAHASPPHMHAHTQNENRSKEQNKRDKGILSRRWSVEPFGVSTENMRAELRLLEAVSNPREEVHTCRKP